MRRLLLLLIAGWIATAAPLHAAGTITQAARTFGSVRKLIFTCTADTADGSFPATAVTLSIEGRLLAVETDPGATAPTDNYDIVLTDAQGFDVLQGLGANRDTANTERALLVHSSTSLHPVVDESDVLTLAITNNSVNSATITIVLYYAPGA